MTCVPSKVRSTLAWLRLVLAWILLGILLGATVLVYVKRLESQPPPAMPLPASTDPAMQIPPLGVNLDFTGTTPPSQRRADLQRLAAAGIGWVRLRADWGDLEPAPGHPRWAEFDALVADSLAADLLPVVVLDGSPAWARRTEDRDNALAPPADFADFADFAGRFAARYGDRVRFYQLWDEPNIAPHWGQRLIDPVAYARLLSLSATAIRAADADAVILLAALAPTVDRGHTGIDEVYFLNRLYAAGAAPFFDAVAVQPFGFGTRGDDLRIRPDLLNFARVGLMRRAMVAAGDGTTPIWAVRFGWNRAVNNTWRTVSPAAQITYARQSLMLARRWPWLATLAWAVDRPAAPAGDPRWGFALVTPDGKAEPLLAALTAPLSAPDFPQTRSPIWIVPTLIAGVGLLIWRLRAAWSVVAGCLRGNAPRLWALFAWAGLLVTYYLATWPPLIWLCWGGAILLILCQPHHGLVLVAAMLPFHFQHKDLDLGIVTLSIPPAAAALLCTLPALIPQRSRLSWIPTDGLALGWLGVNLLAGVDVWYGPGYVVGLWNMVLFPLAIYGCARLLVRNGEDARLVVWALGWGGALAAGLSLIGWLHGEGVAVDGVRRLMGVTFSPNQSALYLLRSLFVMAGIVISDRSMRGKAGWGGLAVIALALFLTGSRGGLGLGIPAGLMGLGVALRWRWVARRGWLLALGIVLIVSSVALLWGERLTNSETVLRRLAIWQGALDLWRAYPLWGVGAGGFFWRYPAFMIVAASSEPNLLHAHNVWLNLLTGWGVSGLLWFMVVLIWLGRQILGALPMKMIWRSGLLAAIVAGLAHAQVDAFLVLPELAGWFWLALALLSFPIPANGNKNLIDIQ